MAGPLAELLVQMDDVVADCRRTGDRSGYFAALYRGVTRRVDARCVAGEFEQPERMARFAGRFADRYLDAWNARQSHGVITAAWSTAFDAANKRRPIVVQHLMLGMNAHINLDLGIVTADCADESGLDAIEPDFHRINRVLAEMTASCQAAVGKVSPWIALLDRAGGWTDTQVVRFSLVRAREAAWHTAQRLAPQAPADRAAAVRALDLEVARLAGLVLDPPPVMAATLLAIRSRERLPIARVIDVLSEAVSAG